MAIQFLTDLLNWWRISQKRQQIGLSLKDTSTAKSRPEPVHEPPSEHAEPQGSAADNNLHSQLLSKNRVDQFKSANHLAISYWRDGDVQAGAEGLGKQKKRHPDSKTVNAPGMGQDAECFNSFLTSSAKQRALKQYFLKGQAQVTTHGYSAVPSEIAATQHLSLNEVEHYAEPIPDPKTDAQEKLYNMARHFDVNVRVSAAADAKTPVDAMWILLEDETVEVRAQLAANMSCPLSIIETLRKDKEPRVATRAGKTLKKIWQQAGIGIASGNFDDQGETDLEASQEAM